MREGYLLALVTGLLGGFGHCLGMCGPWVASYSLHERTGRDGVFNSLLPHLMYNAGRITTYSFIGALMGLGGAFINTAARLSGIQDIAALLMGILMMVMGAGIAGLLPRTGAAYFEKKSGPVLGAAKLFLLSSGSAWRYYPLGLLLGFIPCGLSYSIFLGSAGQAGMLQGMLYAVCFGLGTVPALLVFGLAVSYLGFLGRLRKWLYRTSGAAVMLTGVYFILRAGIFHARM